MAKRDPALAAQDRRAEWAQYQTEYKAELDAEREAKRSANEAYRQKLTNEAKGLSDDALRQRLRRATQGSLTARILHAELGRRRETSDTAQAAPRGKKMPTAKRVGDLTDTARAAHEETLERNREERKERRDRAKTAAAGMTNAELNQKIKDAKKWDIRGAGLGVEGREYQKELERRLNASTPPAMRKAAKAADDARKAEDKATQAWKEVEKATGFLEGAKERGDKEDEAFAKERLARAKSAAEAASEKAAEASEKANAGKTDDASKDKGKADDMPKRTKHKPWVKPVIKAPETTEEIIADAQAKAQRAAYEREADRKSREFTARVAVDEAGKDSQRKRIEKEIGIKADDLRRYNSRQLAEILNDPKAAEKAKAGEPLPSQVMGWLTDEQVEKRYTALIEKSSSGQTLTAAEIDDLAQYAREHATREGAKKSASEARARKAHEAELAAEVADFARRMQESADKRKAEEAKTPKERAAERKAKREAEKAAKAAREAAAVEQVRKFEAELEAGEHDAEIAEAARRIQERTEKRKAEEAKTPQERAAERKAKRDAEKAVQKAREDAAVEQVRQFEAELAAGEHDAKVAEIARSMQESEDKRKAEQEVADKPKQKRRGKVTTDAQRLQKRQKQAERNWAAAKTKLDAAQEELDRTPNIEAAPEVSKRYDASSRLEYRRRYELDLINHAIEGRRKRIQDKWDKRKAERAAKADKADDTPKRTQHKHWDKSTVKPLDEETKARYAHYREWADKSSETWALQEAHKAKRAKEVEAEKREKAKAADTPKAMAVKVADTSKAMAVKVDAASSKSKAVKVDVTDDKGKTASAIIWELPQTGHSNDAVDRMFDAKLPGRRVSASGRKYTETRKNRSDTKSEKQRYAAAHPYMKSGESKGKKVKARKRKR